jgi:hypothetical protein
MKEKLASLISKYEDFKKGNENPYIVKSEALLVLEEAKEKGLDDIVDDVEEILLDVEFSINEDKCKCNCNSC